jgi:hypothetical protein
MAFSNTTLSILVIISLALALAAVALLVAPGRARRRRTRVRPGLPPDQEMEALVQAQARSVQRLENAVRQLAASDKKLGGLVEGALRHVGVVRFDAFEDMGGRLSFSAALLDGHGDGVVITSINGRQETRCYAKQVRGGTSIHNLSDEERQAIREALASARQIVEAS